MGKFHADESDFGYRIREEMENSPMVLKMLAKAFRDKLKRDHFFDQGILRACEKTKESSDFQALIKGTNFGKIELILKQQSKKLFCWKYQKKVKLDQRYSKLNWKFNFILFATLILGFFFGIIFEKATENLNRREIAELQPPKHGNFSILQQEESKIGLEVFEKVNSDLESLVKESIAASQKTLITSQEILLASKEALGNLESLPGISSEIAQTLNVAENTNKGLKDLKNITEVENSKRSHFFKTASTLESYEKSQSLLTGNSFESYLEAVGLCSDLMPKAPTCKCECKLKEVRGWYYLFTTITYFLAFLILCYIAILSIKSVDEIEFIKRNMKR